MLFKSGLGQKQGVGGWGRGVCGVGGWGGMWGGWVGGGGKGWVGGGGGVGVGGVTPPPHPPTPEIYKGTNSGRVH